MTFCFNLNNRPMCHTLSIAFETSQNTIQETYYYLKLGTYYERCQLTETLISGEIRILIDTCFRDYYLWENYTYLFWKQSFLLVVF